MKKTLIITVIAVFLLGGCTTTNNSSRKKSDPKDAAKSYFDLGVAYMGKGRYDLAEPKLQRSISLKPTPEAYNALAVLYEELHDNAIADDTYKKLVTEFPEYGRGYLNYNIFLCKYDRRDQIESLANAMAAQGQKIAAIAQIAAGNCALSKGDDVAARRHYNQALQYEQYAAGALLPLAEMDLNKGFAAEAKEKVDLVNNYIGYSAASVYLSVLANRDLGNRAEERKMTQVLRTRYANSPEAKKLFGN